MTHLPRSTSLHSALLVLAATATALTLAVPASAASLTFLSPDEPTTVTGPLDVLVRVERQVGEDVQGVTVRLSEDGIATAAGTTTRELACAEGSGCNTLARQEDRWGGVQLAPDGGALATRPVCNGRYLLQARPHGGDTWAGVPVILSDTRVDAVASFTADGEPREAVLSWSPASAAPDVALRVERRAAGTRDWRLVAELPASASGYTDRGVAAGSHDYRIVSARGDGLVRGEPAAPCADDEPDVTATSAVRSVTVAPGPTPSPSPGSADDGSGATGDGSGAGTGEPTDGGAPGQGDGDAGDGAADGSTDDVASPAPPAGTTGSRPRVAAPPPPSRSSTTARAPEIAAPRAPGESYFGQDDPFADELPYGEVELEAMAGDQEQTLLERVIPGSWSSVGELGLDPRRILTSIAAGLVLVTAGLHLRRWMGEARD